MFPTHVGMNRYFTRVYEPRLDVPHTRGDEPENSHSREGGNPCSPHTWG